ncbi:hypothetical protein, partial [Herbaspirillum rubrisubalbicans]|uniref:hypothetical protein n=1 Tax=Herbaspirillum rubrisubalbicans TaxID=80842 RepID=UPI001C12E42C
QPVILLVRRVSFCSLWLRTRRQFPANSPFTQNYVQALPHFCDHLSKKIIALASGAIVRVDDSLNRLADGFRPE